MSHTPSPQAALRGEPGYVWRSGQDRRLDMIRRWAAVNGRILDNGCGLGTYLQALAPFSAQRFGLEVESDRARQALPTATGIVQAVGESLPFADDTFDCVLSNEVIEHVLDGRQTLSEMARLTRPGRRVVVFCPNRWYPVEQHGIFWRGRYHFGNIPLVNYLPDPSRNRMAPLVRAYTARRLRRLTRDLPVGVVQYTPIFGGYDNIMQRRPRFGRILRRLLYILEHTPFNLFGLSHLLVLEKIGAGRPSFGRKSLSSGWPSV